MTRPLFLLAHGWAGAPSLWGGLVAELVRAGVAADDIHTWDQGYFGSPYDPVLPSSRPVIGIGHSLGAALLHQRGGLAGLVCVNGFTRFAATSGFAGMPPRILMQMQRRFDADPKSVLQDFTARAGLPLPAGIADPARLGQGLALLATIDVRALPPPPVMRILAGAGDPIVTPAHAAACYGENIRLVRGGHDLPLTAAEDCADLILEVAALC